MAAPETLLPPDATRELAALGEVMSGLEGAQGVLSVESLKAEMETARLRIFAETQTFVEEHPELHEYYSEFVARQRQSGLPEGDLLDDEEYYEATLFLELFAPPVSEPAPQQEHSQPTVQSTLFIDGQEVTRDEALVLFADILHSHGVPMSVTEIKNAGLSRYINADQANQRSSQFANLRRKFKDALCRALGTSDMFHEEGPTRARRYSLTVGELVVLSAIHGDQPADVPVSAYTSSRDASPSSAGAAPKAAAVDQAASTEVHIDTAADTSEMVPPDAHTVELMIRGEAHRLTPLQKQIIDAILAGNHRMKDIIGFLQNGERWADDQYFQTEVLPAFRSLEHLRFEGKPLVSQRRSEATGHRITEYHLPPNARLQMNKKKGTTSLVFTDPSTFQPKAEKSAPPRRSSRQNIARSTPAAAQLAERPLEDPVIAARIQGQRLIKSDGSEIQLDISQKKILRALEDNRRLTVADIVGKVSEPGQQPDATQNSVVAGILSELQRSLGSDALHRKKGKPGQPPRWWIVPGTIIFEPDA